jgi:hypothetical protein
VTAEGSVTPSESSRVTEPQVTAPVAKPKKAGEVEVEVSTFVASLKFPDGDPRRVLGSIAIRLARRVDQSGAAPAAIRELRVLLAQISEVPDAPAGPLDRSRAQRATRRIDTLLAAAS